MKREFADAFGKGMGEVLRDMAEYLSRTVTVEKRTAGSAPMRINLRLLSPSWNMPEQFLFALRAEADLQGYDAISAENLCRRVCANLLPSERIDALLGAFGAREGDAFTDYERRYGNRFRGFTDSYWGRAAAVGADTGSLRVVADDLRAFVLRLLEFAFTEGKKPEKTYGWGYYESFLALMEELSPKKPQPLTVRAVGGVGKKTADGYAVSIGVDLENPNPDFLARDVRVDIDLKGADGKVVATIGDSLLSLDPAASYHFGVVKELRGIEVGGISARVSATSFLRLDTPIMNHLTLTDLRVSRKRRRGARLSGVMTSGYDRPIRAFTLHFQFLGKDGKILGGGSEWFFGGIAPGEKKPFSVSLPIGFAKAKRTVWSVDFDALELISD